MMMKVPINSENIKITSRGVVMDNISSITAKPILLIE